MATAEEARQATVVAEASFERAIGHADQSQASCAEAAGGIESVLPLVEEVIALRKQFDEKIQADKAKADAMLRKQEAARNQIRNSGMEGTTNSEGLTLINNTRTLGEAISSLSGTLMRAEAIADQTGAAALTSYFNRLERQKGQVADRAAERITSAKGGYRETISEIVTYRGHIALAEAAAASAAHVRKAGEKTGAVLRSAEANKNTANLMATKFGRLLEIVAVLNDVRRMANYQIKEADFNLNNAGDTLAEAGVLPSGGADIFGTAAAAQEALKGIPFSMHSFDLAYKKLRELAVPLQSDFNQVVGEQRVVANEASQAAIRCDGTADAGEAYARQYFDVEGTGW